MLGYIYGGGDGVPQDFVQALKWYILAQAQIGDVVVKYRDKIMAKMTPAQIAEAERLAREWRPQTSGDN